MDYQESKVFRNHISGVEWMTVQKQTLMKTRSQMTCLVNKRMEDSESLENRIIEVRSCNLVEINKTSGEKKSVV